VVRSAGWGALEAGDRRVVPSSRRPLRTVLCSALGGLSPRMSVPASPSTAATDRNHAYHPAHKNHDPRGHL